MNKDILIKEYQERLQVIESKLIEEEKGNDCEEISYLLGKYELLKELIQVLELTKDD